MPTTIFLIRHGKTAANLENRFAGRSSEPLHPQGSGQIMELAENLKNRRPTAIYAGPLARTSQSAQIIGHTTGAPVWEDGAFNEILIPHWDGLTKEEIIARFGPEYPTWLTAPDKFNLPGCETLQQVQERAVAGIEGILRSRPGETVVVVSHLIVVRCLILHYGEQPLASFRNIKVDNGAVTGLLRSEAGTTKVVRVD